MAWASRWLYKACPRCCGDIYIGQDEEGLAAHCLQCGFERSLPPLRVATPLSPARFPTRMSLPAA